MSKKLLNGSELAGFIKERQAKTVRSLIQSKNIEPKLAIVQVKDDPVINTYVRLKKAYGADIGIGVEVHKISQSETPKLLNTLNNDDSVHGIIIQLPLTDTTETDELCNMVAPGKDVDGLGDPNIEWTHGRASSESKLQGEDEQQSEAYERYDERAAESSTQQDASSASRVSGSARKQTSTRRGSFFQPATPLAILWLLAGYNIELKDKKILIVGKGKLVGKPLIKSLRASGHDVTVADSKTKSLKAVAEASDIIITATGSPAILYSDMIKEDAVVVDAGVASEAGKIVGDLADDVYEREDLTITPKKGGVGPLTICALFENVIISATT